ncbi:MAG: hypothetical protein HYZ53_15395 [Planctomycetes bacterium]|nr:hypothetical protein [Planctomycetota bacterium]
MELPFRREALLGFAARIEEEERRLAEQETPEERFRLGLGLSQLARVLARGVRGSWLDEDDDLAAKAQRYAAPLRAAIGGP